MKISAPSQVSAEKQNRIEVGIVGAGAIGSVLIRWLREHNPACDLKISDPAKGFFDSMAHVDCVFVSIHIPTESDGTQNLDNLEGVLAALPRVPVFIRTTILPGTSERLSRDEDREVYFLPEFLTERTAYDDFCRQSMIFTGRPDLLRRIFIGKEYIEMSSREAELTKYAHNVFGALKVTFFNGIERIASELGCDYRKIQEGVLQSGYVNLPHTAVPGPDGQYGYGGKCFPKDINAFAHQFQNAALGNLLAETIRLNDQFRQTAPDKAEKRTVAD